METYRYTIHGDRREMVVVARDDANHLVVGYLRMTPRELPYGQTTVDRTYAEIRELWVVADHRRRGIATTMARNMLTWAARQGFTHVNVETSARSHTAQEFWKSLKFEPRSLILDFELGVDEE
jgi:ribosomal protein S18 acetylase RimI-like enzyme